MSVAVAAQRAPREPVALVGEDVDDHLGLAPGLRELRRPALPAQQEIVVLDDHVRVLAIGGEGVDVEHEQPAGREVRP